MPWSEIHCMSGLEHINQVHLTFQLQLVGVAAWPGRDGPVDNFGGWGVLPLRQRAWWCRPACSVHSLCDHSGARHCVRTAVSRQCTRWDTLNF